MNIKLIYEKESYFSKSFSKKVDKFNLHSLDPNQLKGKRQA